MPNDDEKTPEQKAAELQTQLDAALAEAEKWKNLSRQNETRAKENAEKAKKFDDAEAASQSDIEKANARAEAAEKALNDRDAKDATSKLRADIAKAKGVPEALLRGASEDELNEHADELAKAIKPPEAPGADGQGNEGEPIEKKDLSAEDIVKAATSR